MLIGYARVSKADGTQLLDLQRDALLGAGIDEERIYEDRASGRHDHRPGLDACLKALQPGNTFVVWKLDRLGRNLKHLVTTVEELHDRDIGLRVLAGAEIDTTTANGRLVFGIFAALAEFERELIAERTRAGLAAARARGRLGGRPRKMDVAMLRLAMHAMADRDTLVHDLVKRLGITTTTLYMYVNGDGSVKAPGQKLLDAAPGRMSQEGGIPVEALLDLRRRLHDLPPRHAGRRVLVKGAASFFGVSRATRRATGRSAQFQPRSLRRAVRRQDGATTQESTITAGSGKQSSLRTRIVPLLSDIHATTSPSNPRQPVIRVGYLTQCMRRISRPGSTAIRSVSIGRNREKGAP